MGKASVKVEGGKMVNVEVKGSEVSVTGDFFIEPPKAHEKIEEQLEALEPGATEHEIVEEVEQVDARLIGFSARDVAEAFRKATGDQS